MKKIHDTVKAKFLRAALGGRDDQFLIFSDWRLFITLGAYDSKLDRLMSFKLWWPQHCSHPVKLKFYIADTFSKKIGITRIITGYLFHYREHQINSDVYIQPEPDSEPRSGWWWSYGGGVERVETADTSEWGLLWVRGIAEGDPYRVEKKKILSTGERYREILFPSGTPQKVRDFLLKPCWWPFHSHQNAIRIKIYYLDSYEPVSGYLGRDGHGFIYIQGRKNSRRRGFVDVGKIKIMSGANKKYSHLECRVG